MKTVSEAYNNAEMLLYISTIIPMQMTIIYCHPLQTSILTVFIVAVLCSMRRLDYIRDRRGGYQHYACTLYL